MNHGHSKEKVIKPVFPLRINDTIFLFLHFPSFFDKDSHSSSIFVQSKSNVWSFYFCILCGKVVIYNILCISRTSTSTKLVFYPTALKG